MILGELVVKFRWFVCTVVADCVASDSSTIGTKWLGIPFPSVYVLATASIFVWHHRIVISLSVERFERNVWSKISKY